MVVTTRAACSIRRLTVTVIAPLSRRLTTATATTTVATTASCTIAPSQVLGQGRKLNVPPSLEILGKSHETDEVTNASQSVLSKVSKRLHLVHNHPINIIKRRIENYFQESYAGYTTVDSLNPIVTLKQNFDDLLFPVDHPGRKATDTYYINSGTVLRTHTSAHQSEVLSSKVSDAYLLTADVYRRDEIDISHYPVFHQMEGIRTFPRGDLNPKLYQLPALSNASTEKVSVTDNTVIGVSNPIQASHSDKEVELVRKHLQRSLEGMVLDLFGADKNLQMRWIEGYFPFTSPSWELEVMYQGKWLELCGCGVIQQKILDNTGNSDRIGWAFGLGLERIAMVMFNIPDIRLFWSEDQRFLSQFSSGKIAPFQQYSKYPPCYKDISFWCPPAFHDNEMFEVVRDIAGDIVEDVTLIDVFTNPKTGRISKCYRINYRSMDRTFTNEAIDVIQEQVRIAVSERYSVELRG